MKRLKKNRKKMPLAFQLMGSLMVFVAIVFLLFGLLNNLFLEDYYRLNKKKELLSGYEQIENAAKEGILLESSFDIPFEKICANGNISIILLGKDRRLLLRTSLHDIKDYSREMMNLMDSSMLAGAKFLEQNDRYAIASIPDARMGEDYLIFWGVLETGEFLYMRTALESLRASADITNHFFLIAAFAALILAAGISYALSRRIARPIRELTDIAEYMTQLQFHVRYRDKEGVSEELSRLGNHMNSLSETLEKAISGLKSANIELQRDIRKKEEIDEMRKEFLSNVSHELKTPLALIRGYAEGLEECIDDPDSRAFYCDVIIDEAEKMDRMVRKLLTLNQLEFGNEQPQMDRFDITELINGMLQSSKLMAEKEGITLVFACKEPLFVWGDEFRVEEVLSNYLSNAIHYAKGEKRVVISAEKRDKLLRVSVFNTGERIPEEELDKIWIKFYKVDKARTREYGGNGIGLSIVKAIMDSMKRACGVQNHPDGVEFWMELELG